MYMLCRACVHAHFGVNHGTSYTNKIGYSQAPITKTTDNDD